MTNPKDEIARLLESAEEAAYKRGWDDACEAIMKAAGTSKADYFLPPPAEGAEETATMATPRRTGRPSSNAIEVVEDCISASPGKKGVDVVKAAQLVDPAIPERTVRTCLRRLKLSKKIWQRNGLWYPKPPRVRLENENEEAISSPPHH
ncbi:MULTISPECIES: hypothetical protein [unclassified Tardiphaga]|uniref:hypothetical protein n=1 Tax=unclassified Tardiphaga TaxID=2631404 RepID=UPI000E728BFD